MHCFGTDVIRLSRRFFAVLWFWTILDLLQVHDFDRFCILLFVCAVGVSTWLTDSCGGSGAQQVSPNLRKLNWVPNFEQNKNSRGLVSRLKKWVQSVVDVGRCKGYCWFLSALSACIVRGHAKARSVGSVGSFLFFPLLGLDVDMAQVVRRPALTWLWHSMT